VQQTVTTPDEQADTVRTLTGYLNAPAINSDFRIEICAAVLAALGVLPTNSHAIIDQAIYRLFLKLKDLVRKSGAVTLDDFGTFSTIDAPELTHSASYPYALSARIFST